LLLYNIYFRSLKEEKT